MKNFKKILMGLCVGGLLCLLAAFLAPNSHHWGMGGGGSGKILSDLQQLRAGVILLSQGMYYLDDVSKDVSDVSYDVYKNARLHHNQKDNLVKLFNHGPYGKEDLYAFYITDSGHWVGYNLVPYYKRLIGNLDIGPLYGIDNVKDSIRKNLEWAVRKKNYPFYGTNSINTPPLSADALYFYKASDDAIWGYVPFK